MTERQAWLYLAKRWDKAFLSDGYTVTNVCDDCTHGLCQSLCHLEDEGEIDSNTRLEMSSKIPKSADFAPYVWPMTIAGAKKRAAFCRRMAAKCKPKRKTAKARN